MTENKPLLGRRDSKFSLHSAFDLATLGSPVETRETTPMSHSPILPSANTLPTSWELQTLASQHPDAVSILNLVSTPIQDKARRIIELSQELQELSASYDLELLREKVRLQQLTAEEQRRLRELERQAKIKAEKDRMGKKLRGIEKRHFKATGELPKEHKDRMFNEFLQWANEKYPKGF